MNTPPCPVCSTPLRWFPEQHAWGCDRCQQMLAPAVPQAQVPRPAGRAKLPWVLAGGGVVLVGVVLLVVGLRGGGDELDCERYVDKKVALATEGLTGADLELVGQRSRAINSDACQAGNVSASEAACVERSTTQDEALGCFGLGGAPPATATGGEAPAAVASAAAPGDATPPARAAQAVATAVEVLDAFTAALGDDRCGKEDEVHAVAVATADKVAAVRAAMSDPVVAQATGQASLDALKAAYERWSTTRIDGTCRVQEDIQVVDRMLSVKAAPADGAPANP